MSGQDITAERSRLMTGGKRGPRLVSEMEIVENLTLTYNADGNVDTIVKDKIRSDGVIWRKTMTFVYDAATKALLSKTEVLELVS